MTKLAFTTGLFNIINDLLEVGITSCNIHEARTQLDYLFDDFEEQDGLPVVFNTKTEYEFLIIDESGCYRETF